jgi:hypothetical protein
MGKRSDSDGGSRPVAEQKICYPLIARYNMIYDAI